MVRFQEVMIGVSERGSRDLPNGTNVASQLANFSSVFTSIVYDHSDMNSNASNVDCYPFVELIVQHLISLTLVTVHYICRKDCGDHIYQSWTLGIPPDRSRHRHDAFWILERQPYQDVRRRASGASSSGQSRWEGNPQRWALHPGRGIQLSPGTRRRRQRNSPGGPCTGLHCLVRLPLQRRTLKVSFYILKRIDVPVA